MFKIPLMDLVGGLPTSSFDLVAMYDMLNQCTYHTEVSGMLLQEHCGQLKWTWLDCTSGACTEWRLY